MCSYEYEVRAFWFIFSLINVYDLLNHDTPFMDKQTVYTSIIRTLKYKHTSINI